MMTEEVGLMGTFLCTRALGVDNGHLVRWCFLWAKSIILSVWVQETKRERERKNIAVAG